MTGWVTTYRKIMTGGSGGVFCPGGFWPGGREPDTKRFFPACGTCEVCCIHLVVLGWTLIDGTDEAEEGRWIFSYDGTSVNLPWAPGEPDGTISQNCLMIDFWSEYIHDIACSSRRKAICEYDFLWGYKFNRNCTLWMLTTYRVSYFL